MKNTYLSYILADDDAVYRELTVQQLNLIPNLECLAVCETAMEAGKALQEKMPDLLLLDIEMPSLSGIQFAKSLPVTPMIIFISSHSSYAADAFDVDAIDYLVKPVQPHRLMRAVEKARQLMELKMAVAGEEGFKKNNEDSFFIKDKNSYVKIGYRELLYAESLGDFVTIYLEDGSKKVALVNMKHLERQLPTEWFTRISRTHLVNNHKITAIDSNMVSLNNLQLSIGKKYAETVLQQIVQNNVIKRFT